MKIGVVVIGRNEGERLHRCLASIVSQAQAVVYVDSGSTDGSVELARSLDVTTVGLDMRVPFTAARARNTGFTALCAARPDLDYVQFVDGDCEIAPGWLEAARSFLDIQTDVAMVCGRLRERHPDRSIYNMLCDIEWDAPVGESWACGGNVMARISALAAVGGYRDALIAGEEPELCLRFRAAGWKIWRLTDEMAWHDAAMMRFNQWWKRAMRGGYAFAEGVHLHGKGPERYRLRETLRIWLWGCMLPVGSALAVLVWGFWGVLLIGVYPLQIVLLCLQGRRSLRENCVHAVFVVLGKFPEMAGQIKYLWRLWSGSDAQLIEYK